MTMPHLMNCEHSGEGWCLACVNDLHRDKARMDWLEDRVATIGWIDGKAWTRWIQGKDTRLAIDRAMKETE